VGVIYELPDQRFISCGGLIAELKGTDLLENIGRSAAPNNCEHIYCWGRHRIVGWDTSGILPVDCRGPSCANRSPESPPFLKRHIIILECSDYIGSDSDDFSNTYNIYSKATIYPVLISVHARNAVDLVPLSPRRYEPVPERGSAYYINKSWIKDVG
jgi:hypothetical protein